MKHFLRLLFILPLFAYTITRAQNNMFFAQNSDMWQLVEPVTGGYALFGTLNNGNSTPILAHIDSAGNLLSEKSYPSYSLGCVRYLPDKGFILSGGYTSDRIFLMKLDSMGNVLWANVYYYPPFISFANGINSIFVSPSKYHNGYWITGLGQLYSSGYGVRGFAIKTDSVGKPLMAKEFNTDSIAGYSYSSAGPMVEGDNNSCYFTFGATPFEQPGIMGLLKTDSLLNLKWCKSMGYGNPPYSDGITYRNNNILITRGTPGTNGPITLQATINLAKIDTSGTILKYLSLDEFSYGWGTSLCPELNGGLVFSGIHGGTSGLSQGIIIKIDSSWAIKWTKEYGLFKNNSIYGKINYIRQTADGGYITAGSYIIKTDSSGNSECHDSTISFTTIPPGSFVGPVTLHIDSINFKYSTLSVSPVTVKDTMHIYCYLLTGMQNIPASVTKSKLYPDPNNGFFIITLPDKDRNMQIEIYNTLGEKVYQSSLNQETQINIHTCSPGIYLYRVVSTVGKLRGSGKFIIQ